MTDRLHGNCIGGRRALGALMLAAICGCADAQEGESAEHVEGEIEGKTAALEPARLESIVLLKGNPLRNRWTTIPMAAMRGDGTFVVTNADAGPDLNRWSRDFYAASLIGDFNGDQLSDIAIVGASGMTGIPVAMSNGSGAYNVTTHPSQQFTAWAAERGATPTKLAGDLDRDGDTDLLLVGGLNWTSIPVALSNRDGTFNIVNEFVGEFGAWAQGPRSTLIGDFAGDSAPDLLLVGGPGWNTMPLAISNGNGTFTISNLESPMADQFHRWAAPFNTTCHLVGDFDGDGRADVALTCGQDWTSVPVAFSNGDGTFRIRNEYLGDFGRWQREAKSRLVGDFNRDGKSDIALVGGYGWESVPIALSVGDGTFQVQSPVLSEFPSWAQSSNSRVVGDFNYDGAADIALLGGPGWNTIPVAYSNLSGGFNVVNHPVGEFAGWANQHSVTGYTGKFRYP